jgi:hypothetical protein
MKKQIKMQDFKSLIKEGVAKLHRKTLLENRIKQINEELEMLEYDENDLPPNSADDFDVNGGDRYNKKQKQIIPFNDEEINKLQQIGAKKQHSNAIFFELIDKYYIYKLSDGSYELYEEFLGWEPEMGGKGYNSIYFKSLDNLIRKIEPEIEKYKEKKGIEAEMEKAQEERRKAQDWEDFQNRGKLPGVTDLGYNIDLSKFKDNKNRFINKKPNTISELRQIIRESIESLEATGNEPSGDIQVAEAAAESINKGLYEIYDTYVSKKGDDDYLILQVDLPIIGKVYVKFDMEIEIIETPYFKPATRWDPDEGSAGEIKLGLKKMTVSKDENSRNEILFTGMNDSLDGAFETITDGGEIYDRISESFWSDWNENQQDDRDDDDYRYNRGEEY